MGAGLQAHIHLQTVPLDQTTRRMHDDVVADRRTLGVQAFENAQRAVMAVVQHGRALWATVVIQVKSSVPGHGKESR